MKHKILLLVFVTLVSKTLYGQVVSGTSVTSTLGNFISGSTTSSPNLSLSTYTSGTLTTRFTILAAPTSTIGYVGIGIAAPTEKLHVSGGNIFLLGLCLHRPKLVNRIKAE